MTDVFLGTSRSIRPRRLVPGQAMVEFALVILLFTGVVITIIEGARLISTYFTLANAAAEGARVGAFVPNRDWSATDPVGTMDAKIRIAARSVLEPWITLPDNQIVICRRKTTTPTISGCDAAGTSTVMGGSQGSTIEVTVTHTFQFLSFFGAWLGEVSVPLRGYHRERIY
jgi:Flp pilus assembly protein TadG